MPSNEELAQEAVVLYPHRALPRLRTDLRRMPSVWRRAVAADPLAIRWVLPEQCTLDVAWAALERDPRVFPFLPRWRNHRPFALFATGRVGGLLRYDALAKKWPLAKKPGNNAASPNVRKSSGAAPWNS